jgi:guanyl-specific ribonuclease Sa
MKNIALLLGMAFIMVLASCTETITKETTTTTTTEPAQSNSTTTETNNDGTSIKVSNDGFELDTKDGESGTEIKVKVK